MMANSAQLMHWIELGIDIGLIIAVLLLWLNWYRNGQRQKQLEQLLKETAEQLQEATAHLSTASSVIEQLKRNQQAAAQPTNTAANNQRPRHSVPPTNHATAGDSDTPLPPQQSTQATMILRMHREGDSADTIADRLGLPLAQVKLMLKLHTAQQPGA